MLARAGSQWRLPKRQAICPSREHRTVALRARNKRAPDLRRKLATGPSTRAIPYPDCPLLTRADRRSMPPMCPG